MITFKTQSVNDTGLAGYRSNIDQVKQKRKTEWIMWKPDETQQRRASLSSSTPAFARLPANSAVIMFIIFFFFLYCAYLFTNLCILSFN